MFYLDHLLNRFLKNYYPFQQTGVRQDSGKYTFSPRNRNPNFPICALLCVFVESILLRTRTSPDVEQNAANSPEAAAQYSKCAVCPCFNVYNAQNHHCFVLVLLLFLCVTDRRCQFTLCIAIYTSIIVHYKSLGAVLAAGAMVFIQWCARCAFYIWCLPFSSGRAKRGSKEKEKRAWALHIYSTV